MDSIKKVNKLCKLVLGLTKEDFQAVEKMAKEQTSYTHPLKAGKQKMLNELGSQNRK